MTLVEFYVYASLLCQGPAGAIAKQQQLACVTAFADCVAPDGMLLKPLIAECLKKVKERTRI